MLFLLCFPLTADWCRVQLGYLLWFFFFVLIFPLNLLGWWYYFCSHSQFFLFFFACVTFFFKQFYNTQAGTDWWFTLPFSVGQAPTSSNRLNFCFSFTLIGNCCLHSHNRENKNSLQASASHFTRKYWAPLSLTHLWHTATLCPLRLIPSDFFNQFNQIYFSPPSHSHSALFSWCPNFT